MGGAGRTEPGTSAQGSDDSGTVLLKCGLSRGELDERKPVRVKRDGYDIVCVLVEGEVYAFKNACPHTGYKMHEARVRGCVVTCLSHLAQFDLRDGAVLSLPVEGTNIETGRLPVYPVIEEEGEISVEVPRREPG